MVKVNSKSIFTIYLHLQNDGNIRAWNTTLWSVWWQLEIKWINYDISIRQYGRIVNLEWHIFQNFNLILKLKLNFQQLFLNQALHSSLTNKKRSIHTLRWTKETLCQAHKCKAENKTKWLTSKIVPFYSLLSIQNQNYYTILSF